MLVGAGQLLDEPWRTLCSIAGPYLVVAERRGRAWAQFGYQLGEIRVLTWVVRVFSTNDKQRTDRLKELEEAQDAILKKFTAQTTNG